MGGHSQGPRGCAAAPEGPPRALPPLAAAPAGSQPCKVRVPYFGGSIGCDTAACGGQVEACCGDVTAWRRTDWPEVDAALRTH